MSSPRVSVAIPAYYSFETLEACLGALHDQTYMNFEIILVNSSPEERTGAIISSKFPKVRFEQSSSRLLPHAARNRAVNYARGELIVFTDPDCVPRRDWLEKLVAAHDAGHPVVGGAMGLATKDWFETGAHLCKFSWALSGLPAEPHWIVPSANACYSRAVWEEVGPLDGDLFAGDALLSWRAAARGFQPWFEPTAVVEHRHPGNVRSFWRERFSRGLEFARVRSAFYQWSRLRAAMHFPLFPLFTGIVLARCGIDSFRSGWVRPYIVTLPVQLMGHLAWCLGEAVVHFRVAILGVQPEYDRSQTQKSP